MAEDVEGAGAEEEDGLTVVGSCGSMMIDEGSRGFSGVSKDSTVGARRPEEVVSYSGVSFLGRLAIAWALLWM